MILSWPAGLAGITRPTAFRTGASPRETLHVGDRAPADFRFEGRGAAVNGVRFLARYEIL